LECQGTLTLRHGNGCQVLNNWFDGKNRKVTGGIRIIGENHTVTGNHLQNLEGDGARTAICIMNGIKDSPANGYLQVKNAVVVTNSIFDCKHSILIGYADKDVQALMPPECRLEGNSIRVRGGAAIELVEPAASLKWVNNTVSGGELGVPANNGIAVVSPEKIQQAALAQPVNRAEVGVKWQLSDAK
jgi:poly(beta-D-mannuronate) lyase